MTTSLIKTYRYSGIEPGQNLAILGAIHGNEPCGAKAIHRLIEALESGALLLQKGALTLVPICNPEAFNRKIRFCEADLNRVFRPVENPILYEEKVAQTLCRGIQDCDAILDLHSYTAGGAPFSILADVATPQEMDFIAALKPDVLMSGWREIYQRSNSNAKTVGAIHTTISFARSLGKIGAVFECGQHDDPRSVEEAYQAIIRALNHFGLVSNRAKKEGGSCQHVTLRCVVFSKGSGAFPKPWKHMDPLKKGEVIAVEQGGAKITADEDGYIVMPRPYAPAGEEWFYTAVDSTLL